MSAITKQIAAVEFHVNARQANAALESMRQSAEDAREEMAQLQEQANKGVKTVMVGGKDMDIAKRIRDLNATAKAFEQAAQSQIKGVKAWDELWKHAKMGNIEQLTGQQIKAGVNGAKRQYDRLILGDEEDRRKAAAIRDIIDQANIVLAKLKGDTDKVIQTLSDGGHVADEVLQREKKGLEDMLSLTEKFSPEWQDYNRQLQAITKGIEEQAAQEKRLRGELVDANDARREAAKLDRDVAQAAKERHAKEQQTIDDAQKKMQQYQEQRRKHQEEAQKITDEIEKQDRQIASQSQLVESIKRENYERNKKNSTLSKEAREAERTAETAKRAAEKASKAVADTTLKISEADKKVADMQAQLKNLGNTKAKPIVDTEKIDKLKTSLESAKGELAALMKDEQAANEKLKQFGITAADTADDVKLQAAAERALKMEEESRMNLQKELVALRRRIGSEEVALSKETWGYTKLTGTKPEKAFYAKNKDVLNDEYWRDQAGGGSIGRRYKYLQDISEDSEAKAEFEENVGMSVKDAMKVAAQRMREIVQEAMKRGFRIDNAMDEFDESYGKGPVVKLAGYVKEFNDMVDAREKEVIEMRREKLRNIQDIVTDPGDEPDTAQERMRLAKESLKFMASPYDSNISSQVKQQREEVASLEEELKELSETGTQSVDIDKERQRITKKLNKEKEKQAKLESDLQQQMQTSKEKIEAAAHADEVTATKRDALTKAQAEGNKKLQEESQKLSQLQGKREANVASLNKEKEAIKQKNDAVDAQAKIINDAQQTQAKSRQLSIESIEKSIALLKQENRVIGDETNPQWVENEKTIGRLSQRLREMKQHAAELRGEAMSVSQAMDMSNAASGSIEQMEKAISVLQQAQRATTNDVDASRYTNAIDNLTQKLKEAKGEAVSLEEAMEMADVNSKQPYSIEEMQKGLKALQKQQNTAIDPSKYTEAISVLTQKIREAKGEAVSLEDALNFGKQGLTGSFAGTTEQLRQAKQILESTLATTAKGSDRYKEIREALAGIAVEEKRVGEVSAEVQKILDEPKGRSFNELKVAVEQGRKALNSMSRTTKEGQAAYDELAEKVKAADLEMKNLGNDSKGTQSSFEKAVSRLKTYVTIYMGTAVALQKMSGAADDMLTLSDKMGEVRKTTGFSADEVGRLSDNLAKLDTRTPIQNLMELSAAAGQLGLNTEDDVRGFTEAANKMLVALPEMGQDGATQMMKIALATGEVDKIRKQMENGTVEGSSATAVAMEKIASTIDRLRATTAAAAPPVADFVKRVGAVGAQSGITVDQVAALGATVDSLGMGTEMAATAISRMIPAIKNNAFDVAHAIGVTPETIRNMYESGHAMDVILMILQHIKEENLNPDGIEKLLGSGGMGEIMKELNQQGARAGIVFAGLSQNVDELRKNLGTAKEAYADNVAIQQEYDKMNETAAAKWERLKNEIEEVFVNNTNQNFMSTTLDFLRALVDFLTGRVNPVLKVVSYSVKAFAIAWAAAKSNIGTIIGGLIKMLFHLDGSIRLCTASFKKFYAANKANVWFAIATAVFYVVSALHSAYEESQEFERELARLDAEELEAERGLDKLVEGFNASGRTADAAASKQAQLKAQTSDLRKEVNELSKSNDKSAAYTSKLHAKQEQLRQKETQLKRATDACNRANDERSKLISEINSKYSKYLGYMLSEKTTAEQVAIAHLQIVDALRQELEQKRLNKKLEKIDEETQGGIDKATRDSQKSLGALPADMQRRVNAKMTEIEGRIQRKDDGKGHITYTLPVIPGVTKKAVTANSIQGLAGGYKQALRSVLTKEIHDYEWVTLPNGRRVRRTDRNGKQVRITFGKSWKFVKAGKDVVPLYTQDTFSDFLDNSFSNYFHRARLVEERESRQADAREESQAYTRGLAATSIEHANSANAYAYRRANATLKRRSKKGLTDEQIRDLAQQASVISANMTRFKGELNNGAVYAGHGKQGSISEVVNKLYAKLPVGERAKILSAAERTQASVGDGGDGTTFNPSTGGSSGAYTPEPSTPWGDHPDAASTNWSKMNGKDLVARRKQMNEFVLALQGDTDVESVLSEDPALMAAIKKGTVKKDAGSVIAWYDKQRLAIQDVLHSRALTNTGNWKDPKVAHQRAKSIGAMVKNDMSYYMDELDAYYTEQKSQIEDAQNSGAITDEEAWRRMLENERIYRQRRAELQQLYAGKTKEVTQQEADNIYSIIAERTGDSAEFIKMNIGKTNDLIHQAGLKNAAVERRILGNLDKGTEQDFLKMRTAVKKQLDAIEEIVSKERPFDGITKNLRQNVEKMGIIYTDLDKKKSDLLLSGKGYGSDEMKALNEEYAKERPNRLTFLLKESENAYQKTGDSLLSDMRANGFSSWADAITKSDNADDLKEALVAQLHTVFDSVQDAIKKEATEVKKQVDIAWNDTSNTPLIGGKSMKNLYEATANALGLEQQGVSRANSLIGAGVASEHVADKLAIKQLQIQLNMQEHYYALVRKIGQQRVDDIKRQEEAARKAGDYAKAEELALDAKHAKMSLNLTLSEEETDLAKQRAEINARVEESQNRLYTSLKEWGTLLSSSMQSLFEASNTGAADYYNNLAKMRLTGEGSAGGTYVIIDNAGTKDAKAHYENLDGEDALKRQLEIEQQNAVADAWKKVMDDINKKISDQITDWMNAALQTQSIDANTAALEANTAALYATRPNADSTAESAADAGKWEMGKDENGNTLSPLQPTKVQEDESDLSKWARSRRKRAGLSEDGNYDAPVWQLTPLQQEDEEQHRMRAWTGYSQYAIGDGEEQTGAGGNDLGGFSDDQMAAIADQNMQIAQSRIDASNAATEAVIAGNKAQLQSTKDTGGKMEKASKSTFSVMAQAMNMYGLAYQVMSNDNMSSTQKFLTFALQSAGQVAIAMLTTNMLQTEGQSQVELPGILGKAASQLGPIAGPIAFAAMTALLGGLMALATSKVSKSKSQIAQVTGASVSAGRLSTGMLTYAEGNVNEFTDPSTLTPGQQYNVDAADGHTYRARYMGANPKTHLTNGPEFHLVGERGREAIIDANTTRQLQMDDTGIWKSIQTLYNGGSIRSVRRGGMKAFATGNIDELGEGATAAEVSSDGTTPVPSDTDLLAALQASLDRNTEVMQKAVEHGIKGVFNVYGKDGLIDSYDRGKKNANRYGERY